MRHERFAALIGSSVLLFSPAIVSGAGLGPGRYDLTLSSKDYCGRTEQLVEVVIHDVVDGEVVLRQTLDIAKFEAIERSSGAQDPGFAAGARGTYRVATTAIGPRGAIVVVELIMNTVTGEVVSRRRLSPAVYRLSPDARAAEIPVSYPRRQLAGTFLGRGGEGRTFTAVLDTDGGTIIARGAPGLDAAGVAQQPAHADAAQSACDLTHQWIVGSGTPQDFQLSITARGASSKKTRIYETVLDTRDGRIVQRRRATPRAYDAPR